MAMKLGFEMDAARMSRGRSSGPNSSKRIAPRMCGIIGIFKHEGNASIELYEGLLMLQHRGQDSAGMVTTSWKKFREYKENGLVKDVFGDKAVMDTMVDTCGIGHAHPPMARWLPVPDTLTTPQPTTPMHDVDSKSPSGIGCHCQQHCEEAQPFPSTPLDINNNNNSNNNNNKQRSLLNTSRFLLPDRTCARRPHHMVNNNSNGPQQQHWQQHCVGDGGNPDTMKTEFLFEAGASAMRLMKGAYSCLALVQGVGMVAFRDPHGIRPLVLGKRSGPNGDEWCVASEDCAFGPIAFERVRDVNPGEMVIITQEGKLLTRQVHAVSDPRHWAHTHSADPKGAGAVWMAVDSTVSEPMQAGGEGASGGVMRARWALSYLLCWAETDWELDLVCPVPDGSRPAAIQIAADMDLPYREGLVKNRYVGRTFIMPDQRMREMSVRRKLNAMPTVFEGKNVLLIDDSIVRGTTMTQIVDMVRKAGARRVYLASASPPIRYPNVYGVDMPSKKEFVANGLTIDEVCKVLGADGLIYQGVDDLIEVGKSMNPEVTTFDASCFDGHYVTGDIDEPYLAKLEASGRGAKKRGAQLANLLEQQPEMVAV
ncbi:MAG: hypothetical protein WDW38_007917 [Sanguina aurantia]